MSRRLHRPLVFWLIAAALLWRGLVPAGFMPVVGGADGSGLHFALCSGGTLVPADGDNGTSVTHVCPFAAAEIPALPGLSLHLPLSLPRMESPASVAAITPPSLNRPRRPPVRGPPSLA